LRLNLMVGALALCALTAFLSGLALGLISSSVALAALAGGAALVSAGSMLFVLARWVNANGVLWAIGGFAAPLAGWWLLTTVVLDGYTFRQIGQAAADFFLEWLGLLASV
jgi:hypothetical protein